MKLPCEMMEDLLPLYAEDMGTNATRAAVEEHLEGCEPCREKLAAIRANQPEESAAIPMQSVRTELRRRLLYEVLTAVCATVTLLVMLFAWNDRNIYVPYVKENVSVVTGEDGRTQVLLRGVTGVDSWGETDENGGSVIYLEPWRNARSSRTAETYVMVDHFDKVWYVDVPNGGELTLLLGRRSEADGDGGQVLPRLVLGYYLLLACGAAAVLGIGWFLLRKRRAGRVLKRLTALLLSYIAAHVLVMGFTTLSVNAVRDWVFILLLTLSIWGFVTAGEQLLRRVLHDRA